MINLKTVASCYTQSIYLIFDENNYIDKYEIYKDNTLIVSYEPQKENAINHQGENPEVMRPCMFDGDKHTNLFVKDSNHQFMYEDKNVVPYREYSYRILYYHNGMPYGETRESYVTLS